MIRPCRAGLPNIIIEPGLDVSLDPPEEAGGVPVVTSWGYTATASASNCTVDIWAETDLPCRLAWRMINNPPRGISFTMLDSYPDETSDHDQTEILSPSATYENKEYQVEVKIYAGGDVVQDFTVRVGETLTIPAIGDPQIQEEY